jgi:hypothetical protein
LYDDFQIQYYHFQNSCFGVGVEVYSYAIEIDSITDVTQPCQVFQTRRAAVLISSSFLEAVLTELKNNLLFSAK